MGTTCLCLTVRFLDPVPTFHGRNEQGEPEWPPSPLRVLQALTAASAARWRGPEFTNHAIPALQRLAQLRPLIITPQIQSTRTPLRMYVPNNAGDLMIAAWRRGNTQASMADHRIEKDLLPTRMLPPEGELAAIRFIYGVSDAAEFAGAGEIISQAARSITHLGHGIDMVAAEVTEIDAEAVDGLPGDHWIPQPGGTVRLRAARGDTVDGLVRRYQAYLQRIGEDGFNPVPPLSQFEVVDYRPKSAAVGRPFVVFELLRDDDSRFSYPQHKFVHVAGMVRHLAIESMLRSRPAGTSEEWVERYVAGHARAGDAHHRQFSYLPLPSIGHPHVDPAVRRVIVAAPVGDERFVAHLKKLLSGQQLQPTSQTRIPNPPTLVAARTQLPAGYISPAHRWASVTPVILPGHDDRNPRKTHRLIEKALRQSGVEQPCRFEWSAFSQFPKSLPAHKYDRHGHRQGYIRPDHLLNQTAIHLMLHFDAQVPGPLAVGSGRHCGFGVMAQIDGIAGSNANASATG